MEFTSRKNINRGYMKLEVWQKSIQLFKIVYSKINFIQDLNYKLKTQILGAYFVQYSGRILQKIN
jgi:hypothetical protein